MYESTLCLHNSSLSIIFFRPPAFKAIIHDCVCIFHFKSQCSNVLNSVSICIHVTQKSSLSASQWTIVWSATAVSHNISTIFSKRFWCNLILGVSRALGLGFIPLSKKYILGSVDFSGSQIFTLSLMAPHIFTFWLLVAISFAVVRGQSINEPAGVGLCVQGTLHQNNVYSQHVIRCRPAMSLYKYMYPMLLL